MTELQKQLNAKLEALNLYISVKKHFKDFVELDQLISQNKEEIKILVQKLHSLHIK